jgi:predicted alpha/beta-hydrolase family hydrolase
VDERDVQFDVGSGSSVSGILFHPEGAHTLYVLAHGAGAGMRHAFMEGIARRLADLDVATFRYQFPYMEAGRPRPDAPARAMATVKAAVETAAEEAPGLTLFAGGKSFGGRMTSTAASEGMLPTVRGLAFLGFPLHAPAKKGSERAAHLTDVLIPMLFLQGTRDALADLDLLTPVINSLGPSATMHIIEGGNHSFKVPKKSGRTADDVLDELAGVVAEWAMEL